jgi:hypothetical protein
MRPNPYNLPVSIAETLVGVAIALLVCNDFCPPKLGIPFWPSRVNWTSMPEATIDKYGDSQLADRNVGHSARPIYNGNVNPVANTE